MPCADDVITRGRLHPGIRDDNPHRAEMRAETDHAGREKMQFASDLVPAEKQNREKTGFEKKGENAFRRERAAKNIADEARIRRPVRAEFKFHHDARRDADGECQREHFRPKPRHLVIDRIFGLEPRAFHA